MNIYTFKVNIYLDRIKKVPLLEDILASCHLLQCGSHFLVTFGGVYAVGVCIQNLLTNTHLYKN